MHHFLLTFALYGTSYAIHVCTRHQEKEPFSRKRYDYNDGGSAAQGCPSHLHQYTIAGARHHTRGGGGVLGLELESKLYHFALGP